MLILHADTVLSPEWLGAVRVHLKSEQAGWFRLAFANGGSAGRMVAAWANLRSRLFDLPYGDQGLLLPATLYRAAGEFLDQPLMEDVALARALRGRLAEIDAVAVTSAARYARQGWTRRGARNLWILFRYFLGTPPSQLAASYRQ